MDNKEIILNLWYIHDENGIIYSLRAKAYIHCGTEEEKLSFLRERALEDYLIADPFSVPERFHLRIDGKKMPVGHAQMLETLESPIALFEDAIKTLEARMPAQTKLRISQAPLTCTTPLEQNANGDIAPQYSGEKRYPHK